MIGLNTNALTRYLTCDDSLGTAIRAATFDSVVAKRHTKFAFVPKE